MPSFLYPRTLSVSRPTNVVPVGLQDYADVDRTKPNREPPLYSSLPASIQQRSTAGQPDADLPSDARVNSAWRIFIPLRALPIRSAILARDVVTDDQGRRFQVVAAYWNSLGFSLLADLMDV